MKYKKGTRVVYCCQDETDYEECKFFVKTEGTIIDSDKTRYLVMWESVPKRYQNFWEKDDVTWIGNNVYAILDDDFVCKKHELIAREL